MVKAKILQNNQKTIERDMKTISSVLPTYSGNEGAHFGFIAFETGQRQFFMGGRSDVIGLCLSEAIAKFVELTPQLNDDGIDMIAETAKEFLRRGKEQKLH